MKLLENKFFAAVTIALTVFVAMVPIGHNSIGITLTTILVMLVVFVVIDVTATALSKRKGKLIGTAIAAVAIVAIGLSGNLWDSTDRNGVNETVGINAMDEGTSPLPTETEKIDEVYELGVFYYERGEYEKAISTLNDVNISSAYYVEAQKVLANAIDQYRTQLIDTATVYVEKSDYDLALDILNAGLLVIPQDTELTSTINEYTTAHTSAVRAAAIASAEALAAEGDYVNALLSIQRAIKEVGNDAELLALDGHYKAEVWNSTFAISEEYVKIGDYVSAMSTIQQAIDLLGSDEQLSALYTEYVGSYRNSVLVETEELAANGNFEDAIVTLDNAMRLLGEDDKLLSLYHLIHIPDWYKYEEVVIKGNQICFSREDSVIWDNGITSSSVQVFTFDTDENLFDVRDYIIFDQSFLAERYCKELNTYDDNGENSFGAYIGEMNYYCYNNMIIEICSKSYIKKAYSSTLSGVVIDFGNIELRNGGRWPITYLD